MKGKETEIIRVLIEKQEEELNISRLSEYANIDYKNTYNIVKRLESANLVALKPFGKNVRIILNKKPYPLIYKTEFERKESLLKNKNFLVLYKKLSSLNFPFIALIFGSYAKGIAKKRSDIDLLVVCEKGREETIQGIIDLFPLAIHLTIISFENFVKMLKSKEFSVVSESVRNNIILVGIEEYYRLMENVG